MERAKKLLEALTFNLIDLDNNQIFKDKKKIKIKKLCKDFVLIEPDKWNGIVLIEITEYYKSAENLVSGNSKFKKVAENPTSAR